MNKRCFTLLLAGFCLPALAADEPAANDKNPHRAAVAAAPCAPLIGGAKDDREQESRPQQQGEPQRQQDERKGALAPLPPGDCSPLSLSRPLYGNLTPVYVIGIGAAAAAIGLAASNNGGGNGGGGNGGTSGTTGTTR